MVVWVYILVFSWSSSLPCDFLLLLDGILFLEFMYQPIHFLLVPCLFWGRARLVVISAWYQLGLRPWHHYTWRIPEARGPEGCFCKHQKYNSKITFVAKMSLLLALGSSVLYMLCYCVTINRNHMTPYLLYVWTWTCYLVCLLCQIVSPEFEI